MLTFNTGSLDFLPPKHSLDNACFRRLFCVASYSAIEPATPALRLSARTRHRNRNRAFADGSPTHPNRAVRDRLLEQGERASVSSLRVVPPAASPQIRDPGGRGRRRGFGRRSPTATRKAKDRPHGAADDLGMVRVDTQRAEEHSRAAKGVGGTQQRAGISGVAEVGEDRAAEYRRRRARPHRSGGPARPRRSRWGSRRRRCSRRRPARPRRPGRRRRRVPGRAGRVS